MVSLQNTVYAVFCLILVFVNTFCILLCFEVTEFLAVLILIVYVGSVAILFLFSVMMLDTGNRSVQRHTRLGGVAFVFFKCFLIGYFFFFKVSWNFFYAPCDEFVLRSQSFERDVQFFLTYYSNDIMIFGNLLYTELDEIFLTMTMVLLLTLLVALTLCFNYLSPLKPIVSYPSTQPKM